MSNPARVAPVLCVLSTEQRQEYQAELDGMRHPGVELLFRDDAEDALAEVAQIHPSLIIVGVSVGPMEGIEFLAMLMRKHERFDRKVIVLPGKSDPFPAVVQQRDLGTGRSSTENIDIAGIAALVRALAEPAPVAKVAAPEPAPAPVVASAAAPQPPPPAPVVVAPAPAPAPVVAAPAPVVAAPAPAPAPPPAPAPVVAAPVPAPVPAVAPTRPAPPAAPSRKGIYGLVAAGVLLLLGAVVVYAVTRGDDAEGAPRDGTPPAEPEHAAPPPDPGTAPSDPAQPQPPPDPPPAPPSPALAEQTALPLRFAQNSPRVEIIDPGAFDALVAEARRQMEERPGAQLEVAGHTSSEGSSSYNRDLGRMRANEVRRLLAAHGIRPGRMTAASFGSNRPVAPNDSEGGQARNRRVTVRIVE